MKMAFWMVFAAGFAACTMFGIGPVLRRVGGTWTSAPMLIGIALGVAILALGTAFAIGFRPAVLPSDSAMLYALAGLLGAKVVVGALTVAGVWTAR